MRRTLNKLIEKLKEYPQDARVVTPDPCGNGGMWDVDEIEETEIWLNYNRGIEGPHEHTWQVHPLIVDKFEKVSAIYLT